MNDRRFTIFIRDKLKLPWLISFMLVMLFLGIIINRFEPYNFFKILAPILLLMMTSTIWVLKIVFKNIDNFKQYYEKHQIFQDSFKLLFDVENRGIITIVFTIIVFIYFICLYKLGFFNLDIMGCYTLFLGGGTFFFALIGYELHIRLTICLKSLEKQCYSGSFEYNLRNPKYTSWLFDLYKLSKLLRISSFVIGLLFVSENTLFFVANMSYDFRFFNSLHFLNNLEELPLELWIIWIFIFISIALIIPVIALIQINSLHNIVLQIEKDFNLKIMDEYKNTPLLQDANHYFLLLQASNIVEKSLDETYLLKKNEKLVAIGSSVLTCFVHILTIINFLSV